MKVSTIIGAHAYACIKTDTLSMDIRLNPGRSAHQSLMETAEEWRQKAERLLRNAELAEQAANALKA